jgi:hypothetical protein
MQSMFIFLPVLSLHLFNHDSGMSRSSTSYDFATIQSLRVAMGGYPSLESLPKGVSDSKWIASQIDASDRAFLRAGMSCDGTQCDHIKGFHPLMHALRRSTQAKSDRQAWVKAVKQDLWDAVCAITANVLDFN